jgi:hypothetical protein
MLRVERLFDVPLEREMDAIRIGESKFRRGA